MSEISLANQIYIDLREQILDGTIISNDIINEKIIASKYNVSKTPSVKHYIDYAKKVI